MCCHVVSKDVDICARRWLLFFAHAAFVMVQWRMCLNCLFVNIVAVVGAGTAAGAREGELVSGHSGGHW